jgi:hypothetical protein
VLNRCGCFILDDRPLLLWHHNVCRIKVWGASFLFRSRSLAVWYRFGIFQTREFAGRDVGLDQPVCIFLSFDSRSLIGCSKRIAHANV